MPEQDIRFVLTADTARGRAAIEGFTKSLGRTGEQAERTATRLQRFEQGVKRQILQATKYAAAGAVLAFGAVGVASLKMAMDAVESENLFGVSMGSMAKAAREWSEEVSAALGLNAFEVRKNVGTFNVMINSLGLTKQAAFDMAKGLTQLSYDMASFFNLRPDVAFQKLQSGITGEIEPLKRLGIVVDENTVKQVALAHGIAKQGQELSNAQKVQARYIAIMERTKAAHGDLARTIDSPTNALRVLRSQSEQLMVQFGMALLPAFRAAVAILQDLTTWLRNTATAAGGLEKVAVFRNITESVIKFRLLNLEVKEWALRLESAAFALQGTYEALKPFRGDEARAFFKMAAEAADEAAKVEEVWNARLSESVVALAGVGKQLADASGSMADFGNTADGVGAKIKKVKDRSGEYWADVEKGAAIMRSLRSETDALGQAYEFYADKLREIATLSKEAYDAEYNQLNLARLRTAELKALKEDQEKLDEVIGQNVPEYPKLWRDVEAAMRAIPPQFDALRAGAQEWGRTMEHAFTQMILHTASFKQSLRGMLILISEAILKAHVFKAIGEGLKGKTGILGAIGGLFGGMAKAGLQAGGPVYPARPVIVGERGPEVFMPRAAGQIIPRQRLGGMTVNQYIDARGADPRADMRIRRALVQALQATKQSTMVAIEEHAWRAE